MDNGKSIFKDGVENYCMQMTTLASGNIQTAYKLAEEEKLFMNMLTGTIETQFLKMMVRIKGAKRCLDIGTFTGMSALSFAEGLPEDGKVITLEAFDKHA